MTVGKKVRLGNDEFAIVGVTDEEGFCGAGDTVSGYVPFSTMASRISGNREVGSVIGCAREDADIDALVTKTENYLAATYNISEEERGVPFLHRCAAHATIIV